jgi:hypothetical protein
MTKKIYEVTDVTLFVAKTQPPTLIIIAAGTVTASGWTNGRLVPYVYVKPPADGIYEFDLVADEPGGQGTDVLETILASPFYWPDFPDSLEGVKIYASNNSMKATR